MDLFKDRHILLTGGTGALGSAATSWFLERGGTCHIPWLHEKELNHFPYRTHERVRLYPGVDLTDEPSVEKLFAALPSPLWASIHIAGGFTYGAADTVSKQAFVAQMQQNALTCFLCCREAVKAMSKGGGSGGRIVNVAARPALEPRSGANMVPYTASKAAVAAITQALGEEVVAKGILVNAVVPSIMDTPANRASMPTADHARWPKVEDVAATIGFLASPENTVTRGGLVPVYGGA